MRHGGIFRVEWHGNCLGDKWKLLHEYSDFDAADRRARQDRSRLGGATRVVVAQTIKTYQ